MKVPTKATRLVVDYQRARHVAGGRRRKASEGDAGASGVAEVITTVLAAVLVLAACLAAEQPRAEKVATAGVRARGVAMGSGRLPGELPRATVGARALSRPTIRR